MHVGMNRVMTPVWVHEVGEEPRHGGHLLALAVPVAEAAVGEEARPTRARECRALPSGGTRRKTMSPARWRSRASGS